MLDVASSRIKIGGRRSMITGNAEQLPLALADVAAVLGYLRVVPVRQAADKAMGVRLLGRGDASPSRVASGLP